LVNAKLEGKDCEHARIGNRESVDPEAGRGVFSDMKGYRLTILRWGRIALRKI